MDTSPATRTPQRIFIVGDRGDPEAQALLPLPQTDLLDTIDAALDGRLASLPPSEPAGAAVAVVVVAAPGFPVPEAHRGGMAIEGLDEPDPPASPQTLVFLDGVVRKEDRLLVGGRRVASVVGLGSTVAEARARAHARADGIRFDGSVRRTDTAVDVRD